MPSAAADLPDDAVLVHVGPHKTATSAIQSTLMQVRPQLSDHGVTYPGKFMAHHRQAMALRGVTHGWPDDAPLVPEPQVWTRFAALVAATPGRVLVSSEFFAYADAATRARLFAELGAERVHILIGARHPAAMAISTWQQALRDGYPVTLDEWLEAEFRRTEPRAQDTGFWSYADAATLAARWAEPAGVQRVRVLVIEENDRSLLPTAFEQLLALPAGLLSDRRPTQVNRGLSAAEAALLRQVLLALDGQLSWAEYTRMMRTGVIRRLLKARRPGPAEPKPGLPAWAAAQATREGEQMVAGMRALGVPVLGDLDQLRTPWPAADDEPITVVPLDLAAEAIVGAIAAGTRESWTLDPSG